MPLLELAQLTSQIAWALAGAAIGLFVAVFAWKMTVRMLHNLKLLNRAKTDQKRRYDYQPEKGEKR